MVKLEHIRNRSGLLLFVIGIAMLAFILTDLLSSQNPGRGNIDMVVGVVGNEEIDYQNFEQRVQQNFESQRQSNPNIDINQVRNTVWNQMLRETIMDKEYAALDLEVSSEELFDMIQGPNPYTTVKQAFSNPETGEFDRARLLQFLKEDINNDESGQTKQQWLNFENAIRKERQNNKYNSLVASGLFVSDWQANLDKQYQSEIRNVSYVQIPFTTIPDSLIDVSDADLTNYIKENSEQYQQEASREVEYVVFNVSPSDDDKKDAFQWMESIKSDFQDSNDDELFVRKNSDVFNRVQFVSETNLSDNDQQLIQSSVGSVKGPYSLSRNTLRLSKLVDISSRPDSVQARHILVSGVNAQNRIDSLKTLIEQGQSFSTLAKAFSEDPGSGSNGGDLGWFAEGVMVSPFNDVCFTSSKGELSVVNTQFGTHLIEVTERSKSSKKYKIAHLDRQIVYSNTTYQQVFAQAGKFAAENSTYDQFNESSINENLSKRLADGLLESTNTIAGLENPRELIRWAYAAKLGDVSDVFEFSSKIVVACLTAIKKEGLSDLDDVRATITPIVKNKMKSELLLNELSELSTLDEVASNYGLSIKQVQGLNFSTNQVPDLGNEPRFVGVSFALEEGKTSSAFATSRSVCMIKVDKVITAPEGADFSANKQSLMSTLKNRSSFQSYQALQKLIEVTDNRADFY